MFFCELDIWKHRSLFALLVLPFSALASDTSELVLTVQAGGGVAQDVIDPILEFIRMPDVVSGVSLLILIAGLGCLARVLYVRHRDLNVLTQMGRLFPNSEREFANRYPQFEEKMAKFPGMFRAWSEFCETLVVPSSRAKNPIFKNTVRPHIFFNIDRLEIGVEDMKAWPRLFVGIGLFFSLLGFVSVLGGISSSVSQVAPQTIEWSSLLISLAVSISVSLYSFVSGLLIYLALTISLKSSERAINRRLNQLNDKIERGVHFVTSEALAQESMVLMERQLEQMRILNAVSLGDGEKEQIPSSAGQGGKNDSGID
ncbi:MAG: hypothetical protein CBD08_006860 [Cellvibrionales bacterium TMED148]|nr:hypothetical protein [Porticoccaceae bacterium]RPG88917.1 MAG: hypothetical protein CBD08_006860 [Cellvibrionales bacterium TMED148]